MPTRTRYDVVAIAIHWLTAIAIFAQLVMGWTMTSLPPGSYLQFSLYQWHKSVGMTILALSILRLVWRLAHKPPPLPATMPAWEMHAAKATHALLYALLIILPLTGWAVASASPYNIPTVLYGVLPLPHLPVISDLPDKRAAESALALVHGIAGWILVILLAGHVGAALRHHFLVHDDVLVRMLPRFSAQG
jgi:cytochrome b561